jgi:prepilin-type N-terminal cleavage/methylation domain-containing protein
MKTVLRSPKPEQGRLISRRLHWNAPAFTLVEIMIVVAIIGILMTIAVPAFSKSRDSARVNTCIANLKQLNSAKVQWAFDAKKGDSVTPTTDDMVPYMLGGLMPNCPGGGTYYLRQMSKTPVCSLYLSGHTINDTGNLTDDAATN